MLYMQLTFYCSEIWDFKAMNYPELPNPSPPLDAMHTKIEGKLLPGYIKYTGYSMNQKNTRSISHLYMI